MSTNAAAPTGRYIVTNHTLPLIGSEGSIGVSSMPPLDYQVWHLEDAPTAISTPGKNCYVLRTEKRQYLALGQISNILPSAESEGSNGPSVVASEGQSDIVLVAYDAMTTPNVEAAWVFVFDSAFSGLIFESTIISPDGKYKFGLYSNGGPASPVATAYMSPQPIDKILETTWKLQLLVLDEEK